MIKTRLLILIITVTALSFYGCGYMFAGSGELPASVKKVSVSVLENKTAENGIESIITNDIIYEFTRHGKNVAKKDEADAFLSGVIETANDAAISRSSTITSLERRVVIVVSLKLKGKDGNIIWTGSNITDDQAFTVLSDKLATENEMRKAIEILSKRIAEKVYNKLTDNF
ncbi:LPS assembly lipoprotein LptE [Desulfobacterium sp. N47]|uniref:LPS assembly lipoprotein LptE n=1 Tax=Desulfobacterium sp. N47 TaxID=3115210 RepID=UPI003CA849E4